MATTKKPSASKKALPTKPQVKGKAPVGTKPLSKTSAKPVASVKDAAGRPTATRVNLKG